MIAPATVRRYSDRMIEKVGYTRPAASPARAAAARKASAASGVPFAEALARAEGVGAVDGAEAVSTVAPVGSAGGLLGAQEVSEEELKRRRAVRQGKLTLEALSNLRDALLIGSLPLSTLRQLEQMVAEERGTTTDPALNAILDDIELRAAVEMAKLEMSGIRIK